MEKILTIIIPTYNMEKYLDKCLTSLIVDDKELLARLEVLVVIDGARDHSSEIAHTYQNKFPDTFRVIDKENGNYGSCINRGLKEAAGKYIKILDADDWFDTKALQEFLLYLDRYDVDLVLSKCMMVWEQDGSRNDYFNIDVFLENKIYNFAEWAEEIAKCISMHNITYNRCIFSTLDYHQTEGISYTDTEWVFEPMLNVRTLAYFNQYVYLYQCGREGQTVNNENIRKNIPNLYTVALSLLKKYALRVSTATQAQRKYMQQRIEIYFYWILVYCGLISDQSIVKPLLKETKTLYPELHTTILQWKNENRKRKFPVLDVLRIFFALIVVCIHVKCATQAYYEWLFPVACPGFFAISGFLMYHKSQNSYRHAILKMLKLSIGATLLYLPIYIWVGRFRDWHILQNWIDWVVWNQPLVLEPLWYLTAYLYVLCFFYFIHRYLDRHMTAFLVITIAMTVLRVWLWYNGTDHIYFRNWLVEGIPFFSWGFLIRYMYERRKLHAFESDNAFICKLGDFGAGYTLPLYILHPLVIIACGYTLQRFFVFRALMWWMGPFVIAGLTIILLAFCKILIGFNRK